MPWDFQKDGREVNVRVDGQAIFNTSPYIVDAAVDGLGIAFLLEDELAPHIRSGKLVRVLEDWCPPFPGCWLGKVPLGKIQAGVDELRAIPDNTPVTLERMT